MATITREHVGTQDGSALLVTYLGVTEADIALPTIDLGEWADRSVHVWGTFNAGTLLIEGSNNKEASFITLNDAQGAALAVTTEKLKQILEVTHKIRPRVSAGVGVSLNIAFLLRRASSLRT